jgi:hypothetical protein
MAGAMLLVGTRAVGQVELMPVIRARAGTEVPMRAALAGLVAYTSLMSGLVRPLCVCTKCSAVRRRAW